MSRGVRSIVAAGIVGLAYWAYRQYLRDQQETYALYNASLESGRDDDSRPELRRAIFEGAFDLLEAFADNDRDRAKDVGGGILSGILGGVEIPQGLQDLGNVISPGAGQAMPLRAPGANGTLEPLLTLIRNTESAGYDDYYRGVSAPPPRRLTTMTVGEVLAWQDSIDATSPSEAAGAYQILEDTLRGLVSRGAASKTDLFDARTQDKLAVALLERRGLSRYRAGRISAQQFAQELSKEWASLPAIFKDKRGRPATGQSFYAGDGLNKSLVSSDRVISAVRAV